MGREKRKAVPQEAERLRTAAEALRAAALGKRLDPETLYDLIDVLRLTVDKQQEKTMKTLLAECTEVLQQRGEQYGSAVIPRTVSLYNKTNGGGCILAEAEFLRLLICLKLSRIKHDPTHRDSYIDAINYICLMVGSTPQEIMKLDVGPPQKHPTRCLLPELSQYDPWAAFLDGFTGDNTAASAKRMIEALVYAYTMHTGRA